MTMLYADKQSSMDGRRRIIDDYCIRYTPPRDPLRSEQETVKDTAIREDTAMDIVLFISVVILIGLRI